MGSYEVLEPSCAPRFEIDCFHFQDMVTVYSLSAVHTRTNYRGDIADSGNF